MKQSRRKGLWLQPNFLNLWIARTISLFGSAITTLALPLTAISIMHATPSGLAGIFIQLVTAPIAIIGDSLSFFLSALFIWRINGKGRDNISLASQQNLWEQIRIGLDIVIKNPFLRALAMANGMANIFWGAQLSLLLVYMTDVLKINSLWIGIIYACGNVGLLIGRLLTKRVLQWWGLGWSLCAVPLSGNDRQRTGTLWPGNGRGIGVGCNGYYARQRHAGRAQQPWCRCGAHSDSNPRPAASSRFLRKKFCDGDVG